jgi:hypothetical protein
VADSGGFLYSYNASSGAAGGKSSPLALTGSTGIVDGPLVDSNTGYVYVAVGNDNNTSANDGVYTYDTGCVNNIGCDGIFQFKISGTGGFNSTQGNTNPCYITSQTTWHGSNCGKEAILGQGATTYTLYNGAFDNAYYSGAGTTGNLWGCGAGSAVSGKRRLDSVAMNQFTSMGSYVVLQAMYVLLGPGAGGLITSAAAGCSPVTENYGAGGGGTDYIFLAVTANGNLSTSPTCAGACVYNFAVSSSTASTTLYSPISQFCSTCSGNIYVYSSTGFAVGKSIQIDSEEYTINSITASSPAPYTWNVTQNSNTQTFNHTAGAPVTVVSTAAITAGLGAPGGTSGMIIDNTSSSTGASQVYFGTLSSGTCATSTGTGGCAVQASQSGLL